MAGVALVFCRLVLLLVKFVPKLFSVCSVLFLCALKMSKSSTPKNHRLKNFSSKNAHELSKGHKKQRGRRFFTTYEKPIIYNQSSSSSFARLFFIAFIYSSGVKERERERAGQRSPRDGARARGSNRKSNRL